MSLAGILDFGIGLSLINRLAHKAEGSTSARESGEIKRAFSRILRICFLILSVAAALYFFAGLSSTAMQTWSQHGDLMRCVAIAMAVMAISVPAGLANKALLGLGAAHVSSRCELLGHTVGLGGVLLLTLGNPGVYAYLVISGLPLFVGGVLAWLHLARRGMIGKRSSTLINEITNESNSDALDRIRYFSVQISVALSFGIDAVVLTVSVGAERAAEFGVLMRAMGMIVVIQSLALIPLWPRLARAIGSGETTAVRTMQRRAYLTTVILSLISGTVFYAFGADLVAAWTVGNVRPSHEITMVFSLWLAVIMMTATFSTFVNAMPTSKSIVLQPMVAVVVLLLGKAIGFWTRSDVGFALCSSLSYLVSMWGPYLLLSLGVGRATMRMRSQ